ncbi:MAG TPA: hypothetical protein VHE57_09470 [Mycobacteriales bacterium]|nr:hypothetical protein [Mycobacteriales bacterium]
MEWIERRAGLIGVGALVVAAVALGVAIGNGSGHSDHRMFRVAGPGFARGYGAVPLKGGPMLRRYDAAPGAIPPGSGPGFQRFGGGAVRALPGLAAVGALHGELTLPDANGKYQTVDVQRGKVTKVSSTELTVRSDDGYTKTYAAPASLTRGVKVGDEVALRASVAKGKSTVTTLMSLNRTAR